MAANNDVFKGVARYTLGDSQIAENAFWVRYAGAGAADADVGEDVAAWIDTIFVTLDDVQAASVLPLDIVVTNVTAEGPGMVYTWPTYTGGEGAAQQMPPGVAALITASTFVARVFGRKYIAGLDEAQWDGQTLVAGCLSLLAAAAVVWLSSFVGASSGGTFTPGVLRTAGTFTIFNEAFVRAEPGYQRRRRAGVGI